MKILERFEMGWHWVKEAMKFQVLAKTVCSAIIKYLGTPVHILAVILYLLLYWLHIDCSWPRWVLQYVPACCHGNWCRATTVVLPRSSWRKSPRNVSVMGRRRSTPNSSRTSFASGHRASQTSKIWSALYHCAPRLPSTLCWNKSRQRLDELWWPGSLGCSLFLSLVWVMPKWMIFFHWTTLHLTPFLAKDLA